MGAAGAIAGSAALNVGGAMYQNRENRKQAEAQMDFQERMSNTAYQRQMADMKAAGLNPLLGIGSGASSPSGAMAQMENIGESAVTSARDAMQLDLAIKKQKEDIALTQALTTKAKMEAAVAGKDIPIAEFKNSLWNLVKPGFDAVNAASKQRINRMNEAIKKQDRQNLNERKLP